MIEVTRYAKHLPDWRARFGQDRVLVLLNDDLRADPQAYLDRVCDFIGIERYPVPASAAQGELVNSINDLPRLPRVARKARLRELMRPEIDGLERMLGRDLSAWKGRRAKSSPTVLRAAAIQGS